MNNRTTSIHIQKRDYTRDFILTIVTHPTSRWTIWITEWFWKKIVYVIFFKISRLKLYFYKKVNKKILVYGNTTWIRYYELIYGVVLRVLWIILIYTLLFLLNKKIVRIAESIDSEKFQEFFRWHLPSGPETLDKKSWWEKRVK